MFPIFPERAVDGPAVESLLDRAFGPGRENKTVYRLRQDVAPVSELCFLSYGAGGIAGTIRFWPVLLGEPPVRPALLLGPIAVAPELQGRGLGRALIRHALTAAAAGNHEAVLLVGDPDYYGAFGFRRDLAEGFSLPGPVDERRFLGLELRPGALGLAAGPVSPAWRCLRAA